MRSLVKQILAASSLAAMAATPAFAFDAASGGTGNGSLVLSVFDQVTGVSLFQDLGLNYVDFLNSSVARDGTPGTDVTPDAGLTLNFNADLSIFSASVPGNVKYTVFAADAQGLFGATETLVSADPTLGTIPGTNGDVVSMSGAQGYAGVIGQCAGQGFSTVCTGANFGATGVYVGGTNWGDNFQYLDVAGSTAVGSALGFYGLGRTSNSSGAALSSYQYANSEGVVASWLLGANGQLTWTSAAIGASAVPLPAAVWLLLSGLGGLGIVGRRRSLAAV